MATLYVRDVPPEVTDVLKARAAAGQSLSAYVATELATLAARPSRDDVIARFAALDRAGGPSRDAILDALHDARR